jgi:cell division protein FtsI/penicillin-binding protein 2
MNLLAHVLTLSLAAIAAVPFAPAAPPSDADLVAEAKAAIARDATAVEEMELRQAAVRALDGVAGTLVAVDPRTGRVLTIVNQEWGVRRDFQICSTSKLMLGLASLHAGVLDPTAKLRADDRGGALDLAGALAKSSNDYFATATEQLEFDRFVALAREFGFGAATGIALPGEVSGRLPTQDDFARSKVFGAAEGIQASPVQLALYAAAFANGGKLLAPVYGAEAPQSPVVRHEIGVTPEELAAVVAGMVETVEKGTGEKARVRGLAVAGKSGTSGHGLGVFISYAPVASPRIAVAVVLRGSKASGFEAARVSGLFYRAVKGRI